MKKYTEKELERGVVDGVEFSATVVLGSIVLAAAITILTLIF